MAFPALSVPDRRRPVAVIHDLTWWIVGKSGVTPNILQTSQISALWTLGTILSGFRRLSGMTSPPHGTRVKADLHCYCAFQPLSKPTPNQLINQSWENPTRCRMRVYKLGHVQCFYYLPTYSKGQNLNKVGLRSNLIASFVESFLVCLPLSA